MFGFGKKDKQPTPPQLPTQDGEGSWLGKLKSGLSKSSSRFNEGLKDILVRKRLDAETLERLEELLITSDMGVRTAAFVTAALAKSKFDKEISVDEVKEALAEEIAKILAPVAQPLAINAEHKPYVIVMAGVNGTGKTTTIGKLSNYLQSQGKTVMLAACDTFRAAAVEQLQVWASRAHCPIITGAENSDPASVAYEAYEKAKAANIDVLMIDTAGRLQNKSNLMEQLAKVIRVIKKIDDSAPHDSIIVLDATTGQNAHSQVKIFKEMVQLSGIIVTKLDGTAKGGVVVGLAQEFGLPIYAIGVGEGIDDLRPFDAQVFAKDLVGIEQA